jgi:acetyl esterase/lipase
MRRSVIVFLVLGACSTAAPAALPSSTAPPATAAPTTTTTTPVTTPATPTSTVATTETESPVYDHLVETEEYLPDLEVEVHAPADLGPWPVVVTIHGGSWYGGTLESMGSLADGLADQGMVVFNATYRRAAQGGIFPGPVDDVACAIGHAAATADRFTTAEGPLVVVGHSAGAHLAALVSMAPAGTFGSDCPDPLPRIDGFVGLAGPYNTDLLAFLLEPWFGVSPADDPERWAAGNPLSYVDVAPDIPYLLIHGDADQVAPVAFTTELDEALAAAGRDVVFDLIPDAGHGEVNDPRVVGDLIAEFVRSAQ